MIAVSLVAIDVTDATVAIVAISFAVGRVIVVHDAVAAVIDVATGGVIMVSLGARRCWCFF